MEFFRFEFRNVCERHETPFKSIPDSFWWTVVTLMTVGYGDEIPTTGAGKFVACVAMVASLLLLALPISVIGVHRAVDGIQTGGRGSIPSQHRR